MALEPKKVGKAARRLRKFLKNHSGRLMPEQVHTLRTTIRRLEAAADAVLPKRNHRDRAILREVSRIRKRAGKIRDMDVLTANAISVAVPKNQQEQLIVLVQHLGAKRHKQAKRLHSLVRNEGRDISKGVKRLSSRLRHRMASSGEPLNSPGAEEAIASAVQLLGELKRPARLNSRNLHPYRLTVKKLRDVVQLAHGPVPAGLAQTLGEVKDAIGDWHDWEELLSIGNEVLNGGAEPLITRIKAIAARKYHRALSSAMRMRRRYLSAGSRRLSTSARRTTFPMAS